MYNSSINHLSSLFPRKYRKEGVCEWPARVTPGNKAYYCLTHMVQNLTLLNQTADLDKALFSD